MARYNLSTVISFEFLRTIRKRQFWVLTLVMPLVIVAIGSLLIASNASAAQHDANPNTKHITFAYSDSSSLINPDIAQAVGGSRQNSESEGIAEVKKGTIDAYIVFPRNPANETTQIWAADRGLLNNGVYSALAQTILQDSIDHAVNNPLAVSILRGNVSTSVTTFTNGAVSPGFSAVLPGLFFLAAFFIVIMFLGNQMLNSTLEEKENRVTEMILTTINPTNLLIGKVVSIFAIGVIQIAVFALPLVIGYSFFRTQLDLGSVNLSNLVFEPEKMIIGALLLLGGFALFTGALVAIGAVMPTAKDAAPVFSVVIFSVVVPLYSIGFALTQPHAPLVQILAYFPFTAPITALMLNAFGTLPLWQAIIIIAELFILATIILRLAARLFRYGSIQYASKVKVWDVLRTPSKTSATRS